MSLTAPIHKPRIIFIDYFRALLMILVVLGHINYANSAIKEWIYSFHMPAFFFVSGMMINFHSLTFTSIIRKYAARLMVPFLLWALIFAKFTWPNLINILYGSYYSISHAGALTSLWFLPVMFFAIILMFLIERYFNCNLNKYVLRLVFIIVSFFIGFFLPNIPKGYPYSMNVAFVALGFMMIGQLSSPFIFLLKKRIDDKVVVCGGGGLFILTLVCFTITLFYKYNLTDKGFVLMGNARYGNPMFFIFTSLLGTLMILFLSLFIDFILNGKPIRFLTFIGQNTLCIFAVQKPIIQLFRPFLHGIPVPEIVILLIVTILTLISSCMVSTFLNKYLPVFVGKQSLFV